MTSSSIEQPDYWWYKARSELLRTVFAPCIEPGARVLDVGSADGPSVRWLDDMVERIPLDLDPRGLRPGGIHASALSLPLRDGALDMVTAFDVIEHFPDDRALLGELYRALKPGGRLLASVPAYQWAWSGFDVRAGHHRRYTKRRIVAALEGAGFVVERATYAFSATLPLFAAERLRTRLRRVPPERATLPATPPRVEKVLLGLTRLDQRWLARRDSPAGSSVFVAALRPE